MTDFINPWESMGESSSRRVDTITEHNVHWVVDISGNYGLYLQAKNEFLTEDNRVSFSGIDVIKRNVNGVGELILLLHDKDDCPIFYKICEDLVATIHQYDTDVLMIISAVEARLQRWQELLKKENQRGMSIELQMGLFSELSFLKNHLFPETGLTQAVISWVGPDKDKQDFLIDKAIIEVKSHRTSKGEIASISSVAQLYSEKEPLFLVSYGLTRSENGESIESLADEIRSLMSSCSEVSREMFETKLIDYGYIPELESQPLASFILDSEKTFFVSDEFPTITPLKIMSQITTVKYVIDLASCTEFEVPTNSIFQGG